MESYSSRLKLHHHPALPIPPRATRNLADLLYERASHDADEEASSPLLQPVTAAYLARPTDPPPSSRAEAETAHAQPRISPRRDQGLGVLGLAHVIPHFHVDVLDSSSDTLSHGSPAMTDSAGPGQSTGVDHPPADHHATIDSRMVDAKALASAALEATTHPPTESREPAKRVDSAQDELPKSTAVKPQPPSGRATPLKLHTGGPPPGSDDTITTSPTLARHAIPVSEGNAGTLPALHSASPSANAAPTSPSSERLPSFRQLTGQLTELADAAGQHEPRVPHYGRHHSQSFGSATAPSPMLPYHIPPNTQMSPSSQYAFSARSPTSAIGDHYSSPTQIPGNAYYMERRTSNFPDHPIGLPASLPSASSSGESHGPPSSSADGYSTAHTTPVDSAVIPDGMQRNMPILPPPRGMPPQNAAFLPGGFKCDYPGCEAAPFATQYLLRYPLHSSTTHAHDS